MDSTNFFNVTTLQNHFNYDTIYIINIISACIGVIPSLMAIIFEQFWIFSVFCFSFIVALIRAGISEKYERNDYINILSIIDASCGVLISLTIAISVKMYKTLFGILRILWLVSVVTASCSYAFFQTQTGASFLPNDVTLITLIVSSVLLFVAYIASKTGCLKNKSEETSIISELFLVLGAFVLRFDEDIQNLLSVSFGVAFWHLCCWLSGIFLTVFLRNKQKEEARTRRFNAQRALTENVL